MAEAVAATLASWAWSANMVNTAVFLLNYGAQVITAVTAIYTLNDQQQRGKRRARDAANANLRDRYLMVRSALEPRQVVLGRQRVSGPVVFITSYGALKDKLVYVLPVAAHEIDAFEAIYFDDEIVKLDGAGGVNGNVISVARRDLFTITTASDTFTLTAAPRAGTVAATAAYGSTQVSLGVSVAGSAVTVTGATAGQTGTVTITYEPAQSPFISTTTENLTADIVLDGSGNGSVVLPHTPDAGTVHVAHSTGVGESTSTTNLDAQTSVAGATVTVTGSPLPSVTATVSYQRTTSSSKARIRTYLGAAGQAADAAMQSALPGIWTSAHTMSGMAYIVAELDYSPDAFPSGIPNLSARVRGAKLFDPRSGLTVWSENPALMMRYVALSPLLGRQPSSAINDTNIAAQANICDTSANYVVDGRTYTRALYTAGLTCKSGQRAADYLDDLAMAMGAGRWCYIDGQLRIQAGTYVTPLQTLDASWVTTSQSVRYQARQDRQEVFNIVTGRFADQERDYREVDYPRVESSSYITEDGAPLEADMPLDAVTFVGQAQQVAAVRMRQARLGEVLVVPCNMRAFAVEPFDTLTVNLPRWDINNEVFEVLDVQWSVDQGIVLTLRKTDPSVYALGLSFAAAPLPPNTQRVSPLVVPAVAGLAVASGTAQLLRQQDGTIVSRMRVSFTGPTDRFVLEKGGTEVRYGRAVDPESLWQSVTAERGQSQVFVSDARDGELYLVKARHFNELVAGAWSAPVLHAMTGKSAPPANVAGLTATQVPGGVLNRWTPNAEADYQDTEIRSGASWAAGALVWRGTADRYLLPWPAAGSLTLWLAHRDTSRNYSATPQSVSLTVGDSTLIGTPQIGVGAATDIVRNQPANGTKARTRPIGVFNRVRAVIAEASWTNNTGATRTVEIASSLYVKKDAASVGFARMFSDYSTAGSLEGGTVDGDVFAAYSTADNTTDYVEHNRSFVVDVANGETLHAANFVVLSPSAAGDTVTVFYREASVRITVIKR